MIVCKAHEHDTMFSVKFRALKVIINLVFGGQTPFFPRHTEIWIWGWGKKYMKREGNKVSIFKIEKNPIFAHDAPKYGFGDGKKCEKSIWKEKEKLFVLTNCCTLLSMFSAF